MMHKISDIWKCNQTVAAFSQLIRIENILGKLRNVQTGNSFNAKKAKKKSVLTVDLSKQCGKQ